MVAEYIERIATSKHVSVVAVNAGGAGYTDGDLLTIVHGGAHQVLTFVVAVTAGAVTGIKRIEENGAFANRLTAATVTAGNAGTGYAVGDVVGLVGGTRTCPAKMKVATIGGGGAVATLTIFEGGGHYTSNPANGATTDASIGTGSGTGLKVDLTFSGIIGTTGIGAAGGTGAGATFNLTLVDTGWSTQLSTNKYAFGLATDEKELVLKGTGGAGAADPYLGIRTWNHGAGPNRVGLSFSPMTAYNSMLAFASQPDVLNAVPGTTGGSYVSLNPGATSTGWLSITARAIAGFYECVGGATVWHSFLAGLPDPTKTVVEQPFGFVLLASCSSIAVDFDETDQIDVSGLTELQRNSARFGPCYVWDQGSLSWAELVHSESASASPPWTMKHDRGISPIFEPRQNYMGTAGKGQTTKDGPVSFFGTIGRADGGTATHKVKPTPDSGGAKQLFFPCGIVHSLDVAGITDGGVDGYLPNVYWIEAVKSDGSLMAPKDAITYGNRKWLIFPNGARSTVPYAYFAVEVGVG